MLKRLLIPCVLAGLMLIANVRAQNAEEAKLSPDRIAAANELAATYFQNHSIDTADATAVAAIRDAFLRKCKNLPAVPKTAAVNLDVALKDKDKFLEERMERAIPIPSAEELQAEAEAKFPLYKLGEKVKVTYKSPNKDIPNMYEGYYRGTAGP